MQEKQAVRVVKVTQATQDARKAPLFSSFLSRFLSSGGIFQTLIILAGSLVASGLSALSLIIITRQLGPEKFGEFSVGFAILLILVKINDAGMTNVVQKFASRERDHQQINKIFSLSTKIRLLVMLQIWIMGLIFSPQLARVLNFAKPDIIYLAFFLSIGISAFEHVLAMLQSLHRFAQSALINVIQAVLKFIGALAMLFLASRLSVPIFAWYVFAPGLAVVVVLLANFVIPNFSKQIFPKWVKLSFKQNLRPELKLIKKMAFHSAVAFITAGIIENIDILFVQGYLSTYEAGLLGGVGRVALLFAILAYALSSVLNPRVARYTDFANLSIYLKKASLLALGAIFAILLYLPFSKLILLLTIGEQYLPGLAVMNILVASSLLTLAVVPLMALFFSFEAPWYFSISGLLQLAIILGGNIWLVPIYGLEASAWTRLVSRAVLLLFTVVLVWRYYGEKRRKY